MAKLRIIIDVDDPQCRTQAKQIKVDMLKAIESMMPFYPEKCTVTVVPLTKDK